MVRHRVRKTRKHRVTHHRAKVKRKTHRVTHHAKAKHTVHRATHAKRTRTVRVHRAHKLKKQAEMYRLFGG